MSLCGSISVSNFHSLISNSIIISAFSAIIHSGLSISENHFPRPVGLSQPFTVWLTEIPEIQADGSSPWLMMSQADPFLCPLRSRSNPPQFPYVLHDKSHHAFLLTLLGPLIHFSLSPPEPGFGRTGGRFGRVNRKLRGRK